MPVMTRTRPAISDVRAKLAEVHAAVAAARAAVAEAEVAQDAARTEYWQARNVVSEIEERMAHIAGQWKTLHPQARDGLQEQYNECSEPLRAAKLPLLPLGQSVESSEAAVSKAQQRLSFAQARLRDAATAAVQSEAQGLVQPMLDQVEAAFATILAHGPELFCLINNRLLPADALDPKITRLLNIATTEWPEFGRRFQTSPWRNVVAVLEQDGNAPLHVGPVG